MLNDKEDIIKLIKEEEKEFAIITIMMMIRLTDQNTVRRLRNYLIMVHISLNNNAWKGNLIVFLKVYHNLFYVVIFFHFLAFFQTVTIEKFVNTFFLKFLKIGCLSLSKIFTFPMPFLYTDSCT